MAFDGELPNQKRPARPLGRGLEEISHLFLSTPPAIAPDERFVDRTAVPAAHGIVRSGVPLTKKQVVAALGESRSAVTDDMIAIGAGIVCSPYGEIDLLALDSSHRLMVIDVQITLDDGLVARGLSHVDWVVRNVGTVRRLYPDWAIDPSRQPRLALVAPRFSLALRSGVRQIAAPAIACFRYCEVELSGETGLLVERV
jgi:hypothetical protein